MNNQACKVRPKIVEISSTNPIFYPFSVKINRCSDNSINSINTIVIVLMILMQGFVFLML